MNNLTHQLADLLLAMEAEMRRVRLWEQTAPPAAASTSLVPFCYDTLRFEQWLQWVLLPKMKEVAETDTGWPTRSDIFPVAELTFNEYGVDAGYLLVLLKQFDNFINRSRP